MEMKVSRLREIVRIKRREKERRRVEKRSKLKVSGRKNAEFAVVRGTRGRSRVAGKNHNASI